MAVNLKKRRTLVRLSALAGTATLAGCGGGGGYYPPPPAVPAIHIATGDPGAAGFADGPAHAALFSSPMGLGGDFAGNIYVADSANAVVRKITLGITGTVAGVPGERGTVDGIGPAALFTSPQQIAVDTASNLYVTDRTSTSVIVRKVTPFAEVITLNSAATGTPVSTNGSTAVAVDTAGNAYVVTADTASPGANILTQVSPAGVINPVTLSDATGAPVVLVNPAAMAIDPQNNIYVADNSVSGGAGVVYRVVLGQTATAGLFGVATVVAGTLAAAGAMDGPAAAATFNGLRNLALDSIGNIYANDTLNGTIRMISGSGVVSTLAGTQGRHNLYVGPLPGSVNGIEGLAVAGQLLFAADATDNVILVIDPLP